MRRGCSEITQSGRWGGYRTVAGIATDCPDAAEARIDTQFAELRDVRGDCRKTYSDILLSLLVI